MTSSRTSFLLGAVAGAAVVLALSAGMAAVRFIPVAAAQGAIAPSK